MQRRVQAARSLRSAAVLALVTAWAACSGPGAVEPRREMLVAVAVSFEPALREVADGLDTGGPRILFNAAGSGLLVQQIRHGAPVDLFVSASPDEIDRLEREGRIVAGTRRGVASNRLVIVVRRGATPPAEAGRLADPAWSRIATGNPASAPVGRYARRAIERLGLWAALEPRLILGEDARQAVEWVARGEVDAGIVYRSDALLAQGRVSVGPELPVDPSDPVLYEAAIIEGASEPAAARLLLDRLGSDAGRAVLRRHGFDDAP